MTNPTVTAAGAGLADTPRTTGLSIRHAVLELGDGDTKVTALDDVSLDVAPGEFLAVVGPSGSGKSHCSLLPERSPPRIPARSALTARTSPG